MGQAGITPLLIAADRGHMDEVDRLIAAGGDVKASDSNIRDPFSVLAFGFGKFSTLSLCRERQVCPMLKPGGIIGQQRLCGGQRR